MLNIRARSAGYAFMAWLFFLSFPLLTFAAEQTAVGGPAKPWWFWPVVLFFFCLVLGVLAVMAGVGGGVLYVPLVSGFFPFHIDFVRGIGLMVALAGASYRHTEEDLALTLKAIDESLALVKERYS